jgi:hypothetical protein
MTEYKVFDIVEWTSAAAGTWKTKRGTIVRVVSSLSLDGARKKVQIVWVSVPPPKCKNGEPSMAKPKTYTPRLSALKLVLDKETA